MSTRFSQYYWPENVVAVINLLRVLAQMSCWRKQDVKCRLSLIVQVNVVLNRTVVLTVTDISRTCAVVIFRVKVSCITSVGGIMVLYSRYIFGQMLEVLSFCDRESA